MRRIRLRALVLLLAPLTSAATADAAPIVFNYQASQWTGYMTAGGDKINTLGDHTSPLPFTDGTNDGKMFQISLLPFGQAAARPDPVYENTPGNPTIDYVNVLNNTFGLKYEFSYIGFTGQNDLNIQSYSVTAVNGGLVGGDLYMVYNPGRGDPPLTEDLHWIQVLWTNWKLPPGMASQPGVVDNKVDIVAGQLTPFYNENGTAGKVTINGATVFNFYDIPRRRSSLLANYNGSYPLLWMAEDFLALDTHIIDPMTRQDMIFIYGGIEYGWQVTLITPEPSSLVLLAIGGPILLGFAFAQRRRRAA
jgi:hypothetical protein